MNERETIPFSGFLRRTKWEYQIVLDTRKHMFVGDWGGLKQLGEEGWELVAVIESSEGERILYFKRPIMEGR